MNAKIFVMALIISGAASSAAFAGGDVRLVPDPLNCPDARVGQSADCGYVEVINDSSQAVNITTVLIGDTENFAVDASDCEWQTIRAGGSCIIPAAFSPTARRDFDTSLTVFYYDKKHKSRSVSSDVYGRGVGPVVLLSADSIDFGDQTVDTESWQYVTMENIGSDTLNISNITVPFGSGFRAAGDCGDTLAAGSICTIQIFFSPTAVRQYSSDVRIDDDAEDSPQLIKVDGTGVSAGTKDIFLDKTKVDFGSKAVDSISTETITATNIGTLDVTFTAVSYSGDTALGISSNACTGTLAPSATCEITARFVPTVAGSYSGVITVSSDATDTPVVTLHGRGVSPNATLIPSVIEFGSQTINKTSSAHGVTLFNSGTSNLTITGISTSSAVFAQTNNCSSTLKPKHSCLINVTFTPTGEGYVGGALSVADDDPGGSPQEVFLFGRGITGPDADIVPKLYDFGSVDAGRTSHPQDFEVTNTGEGDLAIYSITANSDFSQTNDCPATLAEGEWCVIEALFAPQAAGNFFGLLSVVDNAAGSPSVANMWGYGTSSDVTLLPASINFGSQTAGRSSLAHDVYLLNSGNTAITITGIETGSAVFTQTNDCGGTLAPAAYCTISVVFSPASTGGAAGSVVITDSASGSPHRVSLSGTGIEPVYPDVDISPNFWNFGSVFVGQTSAAKGFTVKNTGVADVVIYSIDANSDFAQTNDCPSTLTADQTCTVTAVFSPEASGSFTGYIRIIDNTPAGYQLAALSGTAAHSGDIDIDISTGSLDFGRVGVNTVSDPKSIVVTNSGTHDVFIGAVSLEGSDSPAFSKNTNCQEITLDAGKSCIINVKFHPSAEGLQKAFVVLYDDARGSPQKVFIEGTGDADSDGGCSLVESSNTSGWGILAIAFIASGFYLARGTWRTRRRCDIAAFPSELR